MNARDAILARIRTANQAANRGDPEAPAAPRDYRRVSSSDAETRLERFREIVTDYRATLTRVDAAEVASAVAERCEARGARRIVVPDGLPGAWLPAGIEPLRDDALAPTDLDGADGVITGCAVAIAETGTIVLDGGPGQGRRALTLVPDWHLCVVRAEQIVMLVPEAVERLADSVAAGRPLTLISGPSATSDIELIRVEGVHGPRTLDVLVIEG